MAERWTVDGLVLIEEARVVDEELVFDDETVDDGEGGRRYCWVGMVLADSVEAIVDVGVAKLFEVDSMEALSQRQSIIVSPLRLSQSLASFTLYSGGRRSMR